MNISNFKIIYQIYFIILSFYYKFIFIFYLMQMAILLQFFIILHHYNLTNLYKKKYPPEENTFIEWAHEKVINLPRNNYTNQFEMKILKKNNQNLFYEFFYKR